MRDRIKIRGMVTVRVLDRDGNVRRQPPGRLGRLLGFRGRLMEFKHHNIITREGDALIADALLVTPTKTKVASGTGCIQVGTGWTGNNIKSNTRVNTLTGGKLLDAGYPALGAPWGNTGDTTVIYKASFSAGGLNADGINEACLLNGYSVNANCLAYAQISPPVNVTANDTLQVVWEITVLGQ